MKKVKKVVLAVGGSGGHIVPALAAEDMFHQEGVQVLLLGKGLKDSPSMKNRNVYFKEIASGRPVSKNLFQVIKEAKNLFTGYRMARIELKIFQPDVVVGFGSYHSLPVLMASVKGKIPLFLHEQNVVPGRVNQIFSRFAKGVGTTFSSAIEKMHCLGEEVSLPRRHVLPISENKGEKQPFVCVVGGSQGAAIFNELVPPVLSDLIKDFPSMHVHHIVGPKGKLESVQRVYTSANVSCCVKLFEENMLGVLQFADLVITRAGATILDEIVWSQVPAIFIPYPGAYGHQEENAKFISYVVGGGSMILQKQLTHAFLKKNIVLALDEATMKNRREALKVFQNKKNTNKSLYRFICEHL